MRAEPDAESTARSIGEVERGQIHMKPPDGSGLIQEQRDLRFIAIGEKEFAFRKAKTLAEIHHDFMRMIGEAVQQTDGMACLLESAPERVPIFLRFGGSFPTYGNSIDGLVKDVSHVIFEQTDKKPRRLWEVFWSSCNGLMSASISTPLT